MELLPETARVLDKMELRTQAAEVEVVLLVTLVVTCTSATTEFHNAQQVELVQAA
jgi:hypothetical protein